MNGPIDKDKLINEILKNTGSDNQTFKQSLKGGDVNEILGSLAPEDANKLKNLLSDREATKALLNSPQAKALLKALFGGKT